MNDKNIIGAVVALLLVVGGVLFVLGGDSKKTVVENAPIGVLGEEPSGALALAQCLKDSGAVFYGAFWCSHCEKQKALFGSATPVLPYVECSTPNGKNQTSICKEKGITGYPTWVFKDGSELSGEQSFSALAQKSGCADPSVTSSNPSSSTTPTGAPSPVQVVPKI